MEMKFNNRLYCFMCNRCLRGSQMYYTKDDKAVQERKFEVGIGGCGGSWSSKIVKYMSWRSTVKCLVVTWLGPFPPTPGFATSLAEAIKENMLFLDRIIMRNFSGNLTMVERALYDKNINVMLRRKNWAFIKLYSREMKYLAACQDWKTCTCIHNIYKRPSKNQKNGVLCCQTSWVKCQSVIIPSHSSL